MEFNVTRLAPSSSTRESLSTSAIEVIEGGLQTTVQDRGRRGFGNLGVSPAGAADPISLIIGNRVAGNPDGAAALEMTLIGATLRFLKPRGFSITGSDGSATLDGRPVSTYSPHRAEAGSVLKVAGFKNGARAYVCITGGIDVPLFLGSASTHLSSRLGGFQGRPLQSGDLLKTGRAMERRTIGPLSFETLPDILKPRKNLRVTPGIHASLFKPAEGPYKVAAGSDRLGLNLQGPSIDFSAQDLPSAGVSLGTIQVMGGLLTILFVDQQTTGGYPQILSVVTADHFSLGQLRPGDTITFEVVDFETAEKLFKEQTHALQTVSDI